MYQLDSLIYFTAALIFKNRNFLPLFTTFYHIIIKNDFFSKILTLQHIRFVFCSLDKKCICAKKKLHLPQSQINLDHDRKLN